MDLLFGGAYLCGDFCDCVRGEGVEVKGALLTLALLAASTLYVGRCSAWRTLRRRAGDGLTLHCAILEKRDTQWLKSNYCTPADTGLIPTLHQFNYFFSNIWR